MGGVSRAETMMRMETLWAKTIMITMTMMTTLKTLRARDAV